jgi:DMSO/TMAO reductase YedYZ heme-binding membrane subunit
MGKGWKRLHRLVYAAGIVIMAHAMLESTSSKRVLVYDPDAASETWLYLIALVVLLAVRLPTVRGAIGNLKHRRGRIVGKPRPSADVSG